MKCLQLIRDALNSIKGVSVSHYHAWKRNPPYIVWAEDGSGAQLSGDNRMVAQAIQGTIDLYTDKEGDPLVNQIQAALNTDQIALSLNGSGYEEETKLIHYEWIFEVSNMEVI